MIADLPYILYWWLIIFLLGILVFPLTKKVFSKFFDFGYPFAKILGILLLSYLVWLLGSLKILPFLREAVGLVIILLALVNFLILTRDKKKNQKSLPSQLGRILVFEELLFFLALLFWCYVRAHEPSIHGLEKFMDYGFINSILRSKFFPPHDMWLSLSPDPRYTGSFTINYYYFGHLVAAVLTKLSGLDSAITYNLVLATLFALCFSGAFSIGGNLISLFPNSLVPPSEESPPVGGATSEEGLRKNLKRRANTRILNCSENLRLPKLLNFLRRWRKFSKSEAEADKQSSTTNSGPSVRLETRYASLKIILFAGLLTAFLVTLAGNLHTLYVFKDPTRYWYPDATRFIPFTIHEFPFYSWVVADLHGHVFDIPFVLLVIAILLSLITTFRVNEKTSDTVVSYKLLITILLGLVLAVLYMTNAWDGIIYLGLSGLVFLVTHLKIDSKSAKVTKVQSSKFKVQSYNLKRKNKFSFKFYALVLHFALLAFSLFLFSLPFNLSFTPFIKGVGVNCPPPFTPDKFGPFLFEKGNCQRSPLWMLAILWGFFYYNIIGFLLYLLKNSKFKILSSKQALNSKSQILDKKKFGILNLGFRILNKVDLFIILLIFLSTLLLIFPEFFYAKDIYPAHFRANTMFKLGYQAFIMLSILSAHIIIRFLFNLKYQLAQPYAGKYIILYTIYLIFLFPQLSLVSIYPYYAINSYYGNLKNYQGLNGNTWLKNQYPDDYAAILWLKNLEPRTYYLEPVIVEAVGESYTDYARVSANTGLPTILGWPVHEWLWRGSFDEAGKRIPEVQTIYESQDLQQTKSLLEKYNVSYVFMGTLEREKYKNLAEEKFQSLGKVVFQSGETKIYSTQNNKLW